MLLVVLLSVLVPFAHSAPINGTEKALPTTRTTVATVTTFHPDCADPHNKEVACTVHLGLFHSVLVNLEKIFGFLNFL